eukprot:scaffold8489_cov123-Isochrysis_galbana.AAC.2
MPVGLTTSSTSPPPPPATAAEPGGSACAMVAGAAAGKAAAAAGAAAAASPAVRRASAPRCPVWLTPAPLAAPAPRTPPRAAAGCRVRRAAGSRARPKTACGRGRRRAWRLAAARSHATHPQIASSRLAASSRAAWPVPRPPPGWPSGASSSRARGRSPSLRSPLDLMRRATPRHQRAASRHGHVDPTRGWPALHGWRTGCAGAPGGERRGCERVRCLWPTRNSGRAGVGTLLHRRD